MFISALLSSFGQNDFKKRPALGVHLIMNDFNSASTIRTSSLSNVITSKSWSKTQNMSAGIGVSYIQGVSNYVDFAATISGSFLDYPIPGKALRGTNDLLLEAVVTGNLKLLSDKYWVSPFVTAGLGGSKYKGYYGAILPLGVGIQVNLFDETYLLINSQYRIPITENATYHFYHSFGVAGNINKKKVVVIAPPPPPPVIEVPKDKDGDGVIDAEDKCPDVKGLASLQGCPDSDGDGITDKDDQCPTVAGLVKYHGCPIPDTDKDGINDEQDKCPTVAGFARYQGCPIPDTDGDGVNDEEDKCPTEKGTKENNGCPVLADFAFDANNVQFVTGSATLTAKAKTELDKGAAILIAHSMLNVAIKGYTDNVGKPATNLTLSQKRADAVKAYLVKKGIDGGRLTSTGFGIENPIADNKTAIGRAQNRRVAFTGNN